MADFTIKQHDTWPPIVGTLKENAVPIDLTTADHVKLILKAGAVTVSGTCTITNAPDGVVSYQWIVGDTANVATYQGEYEIVWADTNVQTVPNDTYFSVSIVTDLG